MLRACVIYNPNPNTGCQTVRSQIKVLCQACPNHVKDGYHAAFFPTFSISATPQTPSKFLEPFYKFYPSFPTSASFIRTRTARVPTFVDSRADSGVEIRTCYELSPCFTSAFRVPTIFVPFLRTTISSTSVYSLYRLSWPHTTTARPPITILIVGRTSELRHYLLSNIPPCPSTMIPCCLATHPPLLPSTQPLSSDDQATNIMSGIMAPEVEGIR